MALTVFPYEAGPHGAAVTSGNSGINLPSAPDGGSVTFDNTQKETGVYGVKCTCVANRQALVRTLAAAGSTAMSFSGAFRTPASAPTANLQIQSLRHSTGTIARVLIEPDMDLIMTDNAQANQFTIHPTLALSTWYRISGWFIVGGAGVNVSWNIYGPGSNTPLNPSPITRTAYNLGAAAIVGGDSGIVSTPTAPMTLWLDNHQWSDGVTTHLPYYAVTAPTPPPTLARTHQIRQRFDYSATTGEAPLSLAAAHPPGYTGPNVGTITINGMVAEFVDTPTRTDPAVVRFTVTDGLAQTAFEDVTIAPVAMGPHNLILRDGIWR